MIKHKSRNYVLVQHIINYFPHRQFLNNDKSCTSYIIRYGKFGFSLA